MIERKFVVGNSTGIHARPATLLTTTASKFKSDVMMEYNQRTVNVKSIMGVMSLAIPGGAEVTVRVTGQDENDALAALGEVFESNFGE